MLLREFDNGINSAKLVAVANQLEQDLDDGVVGTDYTVDNLLDYLQNYDIIIDVDDLYNMIKVPPLKDFIQNIQGDKVIFKGQEEFRPEYDAPEGDDKRTVAQMAKRAMKK